MVASARLLPLLLVALRAAGAITGPRATVAPSSAEAEDLSQIAFGAEGAQWAVGVGADDAHDDEADASTPPWKRRPPHHPHYPPTTDKTIYQVLNSTPQYVTHLPPAFVAVPYDAIAGILLSLSL
jgi:hypothetical protein